MAQRTLSIFIDVPNAQLIRSATNTAPALLPAFYQGDTITLVMEFLDTTQSPPAQIDYSAAAVTVGVGFLGQKPTAGTFTITDTSATQTTAALQYNATAAQVQAAIQAALTTNWSTATVLGSQGGPYWISNGVNGAETALVGTPTTLNPLSAVKINRLQEGSGSLPEIQTLALETTPIALQDTWTSATDPNTLTGNISFDTAGIEDAMGIHPAIWPCFSIQVVPVDGEPFTVYQNNFQINNDLIQGAPSIPTPGVSYYTTVESDARYSRTTSIYVERNSTGDSAQHIVTNGIGANNVLYLMTNAPSSVVFTFDNGTFDGQTITYRVDRSVASITYSENVTGVLSPDYINGAGASISFIWDADNSVWSPI